MVKTKIIRNGKVIEVDASTEIKEIKFKALNKDEKFEYAITPGMPSFVYTKKDELKDFVAKTIRWPGHWQAIQVFKECGLLDLKPIIYRDPSGRTVEIIPREFFAQLLTPKMLKPKDEPYDDLVVMWNTVVGGKGDEKKSIEFYMWVEADKRNNISALQRTTSLPMAITAKMIGKGMIKGSGIIPPEEIIQKNLYRGNFYEDFIKELEKQGVIIEVKED